MDNRSKLGLVAAGIALAFFFSLSMVLYVASGAATRTMEITGIVEGRGVDIKTHMRDLDEIGGERRTSPRKAKEFFIVLRWKGVIVPCHFPPELEESMSGIRDGQRITVIGERREQAPYADDLPHVFNLYNCRIVDAGR